MSETERREHQQEMRGGNGRMSVKQAVHITCRHGGQICSLPLSFYPPFFITSYPDQNDVREKERGWYLIATAMKTRKRERERNRRQLEAELLPLLHLLLQSGHTHTHMHVYSCGRQAMKLKRAKIPKCLEIRGMTQSSGLFIFFPRHQSRISKGFGNE